jgi:hypothetical protein
LIRQIIHYPTHVPVEEVESRARLELGKEGIIVKEDAVYVPFDIVENAERKMTNVLD